MKALLFTAIAIIFLFTFTAQAAEWEKISENKEGKISIDLSSIEKLSNNHYRVWVKTDYKDPSSKETRVNFYLEYDCDNKRIKALQTTVYKMDGSNETFHGKGTWIYINPDTIGEEPFTFVCNDYTGHWEKIIDNDKVKIFIDWGSLKKFPNNHYKVWSKMDLKDSPATVSKFDSTMFYIELDCVNKKTRTIMMIASEKDGFTSSTTSPQQWEDASNNIFLKAVCSKQSKGAEKTK